MEQETFKNIIYVVFVVLNFIWIKKWCIKGALVDPYLLLGILMGPAGTFLFAVGFVLHKFDLLKHFKDPEKRKNTPSDT